mmetsp:Transcript_35694/g.93745  ORF Transcript_35694/g.93745 Transcript_35694/m.93745 type:complete len:350 (-) Transcript_35694:425-1474(-)
MNRVKEVERINARDVALQLQSDTVGDAGKWDVNKSWHAQYKDSAYVYVGGLPNDLSEGDVIVVFSQFGEIVDMNMPRDKETGKTKGFAFIGYEDQRSTVLAVDNFNGAKLLGRTLRCDHCASYHEEQKKDPSKLPDHLMRKLSKEELAKKQQEIERRNAELDDAMATKEGLFATARGIEDGQERDERELRHQLIQHKEAEAANKSAGHIAAVMAKRKVESQREIAEEERQQQHREERKRQRDESLRKAKLAETDRPPPPPPLPPPQPVAASMPDESGGRSDVGSSRWERFLGGGTKKKKKKKKNEREQEREQERSSGGMSDQRTSGSADGLSIEDTNALRLSLGLNPLR